MYGHSYESGYAPRGVAGLCSRVISTVMDGTVRRLVSVLRSEPSTATGWGRGFAGNRNGIGAIGHYPQSSEYSMLILEATGCPVEEVEAVEEIMKNEIFQSPTLDWVPEEHFVAAAHDAYQMLIDA